MLLFMKDSLRPLPLCSELSVLLLCPPCSVLSLGLGLAGTDTRRGREFPMPGVSPLSPPLSQPLLELIEVLGVLFFLNLFA